MIEDRPIEPEFQDDDEVLVIDAAMLHRDRVDLEAGMRVAPRATLALIVVCTAIFARQVQIQGLDDVERVIETGALQRDAVLEGEWWRLVSGAFMHADVIHLVGNMVMLYILGMACEHAFGLGRHLFLYVASGIAGNALAMTMSDVPTLGASGAIFGLLGATIGLTFAHRDDLELRDGRLGIVLAGWSAFSLVTGLMSPFISNSAHFGGLITGLALGATLHPAILNHAARPVRPVVGRILAAMTFAVLAVSFLAFIPRLR